MADSKRAAASTSAGGIREFGAYLEGMPEPHILLDDQYRIVAANAAYRQAFAHQGPVLGRCCYDVSHSLSTPCDQNGETCPLAQARASGQRERVLHLHHTPTGESYVQIELVPLRTSTSVEPTLFLEKLEELPLASGRSSARGMIGRSPAFRRMLDLVARAGPSEASVLLLGESGTGKELVAGAIHEASRRAGSPFIVVDCASLPESLFESELFGHEKGAFTGASQTKPGLVEAASGGTVFLDEVGDIPLTMQVKLLRLLESGTYRRIGSTEVRHSDVRIISATHRPLARMVTEGGFREDLFYRLSTFPIRLPPLRERIEDIGLLADALLGRVAPDRHLSISKAAMKKLQRYPFPGNIRELRNILERAGLVCDGRTIEADHIEWALDSEIAAGVAPDNRIAAAGSLQKVAGEHLRTQLREHRGSRAELARKLGISERSLYRRLRTINHPTDP